jgi:nucleotide-binding universal stress UspA family protein
MLRSLLVGLDGSAYSQAATELALRWATRLHAELTGLAVVDAPHITEAEAVPMGGGYYKGQRDERKLAEAQRAAQAAGEAFLARCAAANIAANFQLIVGPPSDVFAIEAQRHDLLLLGQRTYFHWMNTDDADDTVEELLHKPPRPVVVVPKELPAGDAIVVAYDGGLEAARALAAFMGTGIGTKYPTHIVTVHDDAADAAEIAARAVQYVGRHGDDATPFPTPTGRGQAESLLAHVATHQAQLLVMGAFGHSAMHDFFFGSTTQSILDDTCVPVFLYH